MGNINEALSLLAVGMIMVFIILFLVVFVGNVVVLITNRFLPEIQQKDGGGIAPKGLDPKKMAVLAAVVDIVTRGEGGIGTIQKK